MIFPIEFLFLQLKFAEKVSKVDDMPLKKALFEFTSLPIRFGIPFSDLSESNPIWKEFLDKFNHTDNLLETIYEYHLEKMKNAPEMRYQFGCFSYDAISDEGGIRIQFANNDSPEPGALSDLRIKKRKLELKKMFHDIKTKYPTYTFVISSSWLFNVEAFKRLFPESFINSLKVKQNDYRSLGIWGQFIDKYGKVKIDLARKFNQALATLTKVEEIEGCFPLKELKAEGDIVEFYKYYMVPLP